MDEQKFRHGCLTKWLVFLLIVNSVIVLILVLSGSAIRNEVTPTTPAWVFLVFTLSGILNIFFVIALFRWKKWGFWGLVGTFGLVFIVNLVLEVNIVQAFLGLSGVAILFGVLQIGKEKKGWSQLE